MQRSRVEDVDEPETTLPSPLNIPYGTPRPIKHPSYAMPGVAMMGAMSQQFNVGAGSMMCVISAPSSLTAPCLVFAQLARADNLEGLRPQEELRSLLALKSQWQLGRQPARLLEQPESYKPYCIVRDRMIRSRLIEIARRFQFLDRGFAEYFRAAVATFDRHMVTHHLQEAREMIARSQRNRSVTNTDEGHAVVLGDLGHYCERVSGGWNKDEPASLTFEITNGTNEELLRYLQDALENPYWDFMLKLFLRQKTNTTNLTADVVSRVLSSFKINVQHLRHQIDQDLGGLTRSATEDIAPLLKGVDSRIALLEGAWEEPIEQNDLLETLLKHKSSDPLEINKTNDGDEEPLSIQQKNTVVTASMVIFFLVFSTAPFLKGFAVSQHSDEKGSASDADFWYLISSNIMAVLGSVIMVSEMQKKTCFPVAVAMARLFLVLASLCAVVSCIVYPFCNTGWSSMVGFFGSILSQGAVLVMTQATPQRPSKPPGAKEKEE